MLLAAAVRQPPVHVLSSSSSSSFLLFTTIRWSSNRSSSNSVLFFIKQLKSNPSCCARTWRRRDRPPPVDLGSSFRVDIYSLTRCGSGRDVDGGVTVVPWCLISTSGANEPSHPHGPFNLSLVCCCCCCCRCEQSAVKPCKQFVFTSFTRSSLKFLPTNKTGTITTTTNGFYFCRHGHELQGVRYKVFYGYLL